MIDQPELFDLPGGVKRPVEQTAPETTAEMQAMARQYALLALDALVQIATRGKSEAASVAAAKELLDRGHGKVVLPMEVGGKDGGPIEIVRRIVDPKP